MKEKVREITTHQFQELNPPSMGFPRQEYWSGLPLPSQSGIK